MRWNIKTRFIALFAVLLAVVLALQLYFMEQTSRNVFEELNQISVTINRATDWQILRSLRPDSLMPPVPPPGLPRPPFEEDIEVLLNKGEMRARVIRTKPSRNARTPSVTSIVNYKGDSLHIQVEELKKLKDELNEFKRKVKKDFFLKQPPAKNRKDFLTFMIPDLTKPDKPRVVRYKYNTMELQNALTKARDRNLLITGLFFGLTILAMALMTRRFLKPIDSLKRSFDKVVEGDLSVQVETKSRDEIGGLAVSFNKMVAELRKNREKEQLLQRKERLASLGQLAAGVAHEIKNPLNAINLTIEHLNDKFVSPKDEQAREYIATIQSEIRRLDKIVNNFLNYLHSEELQLSETDINAILTEIIQLYEREISQAKIELTTEFAPSFVVRADGERLKTALVNVIVNAIQAMPQGGKLTVATNPENGEVVISDTGTGIPEKQREHIFDIFYTTKSSGSGLGLPTAYKIIKAHKGEIVIDSREGKGTTVRIKLEQGGNAG